MSSDLDEVIQTQLSTLQILLSMYPLSSELSLSQTTATYLDDPDSSSRPSFLEADLHLPLDENSVSNDEEGLVLHIVLPLESVSPVQEGSAGTGERAGEGGKAILRPRQPTWLSRAHYSDLLSSLPPQDGMEGSEYILTTIEHVRTSLQELLPSTSSLSETTPGEEETVKPQLPEERVWFWFPSLSTREKRDDIVQYAEEVGLTGFVLAGECHASPPPPPPPYVTAQTTV